MELNKEEVELVRGWFDDVLYQNRVELTQAEWNLAARVYQELGLAVPSKWLK